MKRTVRRGSIKQQRTHVLQPGPGKPLKAAEYGPFATIEEAEAAAEAAKEVAARMGFASTVTTIKVHS